MTKSKIEEFVERWLEEDTLDALLEMFDIDPVDAFSLLYEAGLVDEFIIESYKRCD